MGTALSRVCDLECARVVAQGIIKAQLNIEGQKYLTSSMAIPSIDNAQMQNSANERTK